MIFHPHRAIYIHPGKAAGTSIERALGHTRFEPRPGNHDILFGIDSQAGIYMQHATAEYIKDKVAKKIWDQYYKFGSVRNPYTRLVSVFYYLEEQHMKKHGSFENFIMKLPEILKQPHVQRGSHYIPQYRHMYIGDEYAVDFTIRLEEIKEDYAVVARNLGISPHLPHINGGHGKTRPKKPMEEIYTKEMQEVMAEVYAKDFEAFAYSTDPKMALKHRASSLEYIKT